MAIPAAEKTIRISASYEDDGGEDVAGFKARVARQSELISLLKQRADQTLLQLDECERKNESLMASQEQLISKLHSEVESRQELERRISDVSAQLNQMSLQVESRETKCELLQRLVEGFHTEKNVRNDVMKQDQLTMNTLNEQIENYKRTMNTLKDALQEMKSQFSKTEQQNSQLQDKVLELGKQNLSLEDLLTIKKLEVERWKSEHAILMRTCMDKELQLEEAQRKVSDLEQKLHQKSDKILSLASKLRLDTDSLSKDQAISRLKWELKETREELHALKQQFETYKSESKRQLEEERELNMKLRHLQ